MLNKKKITTLNALLTHIASDNESGRPSYSGISSSSKNIEPGFIFVAKRGAKEDGAKYIPDAIKKGATLILSNQPQNSAIEIGAMEASAVETGAMETGAVEILVVEDILQAEGLVANHLYNKSSEKLAMIGVTGTAGKTTTTYAIRHILQNCGVPTGLIGGVECIMGNCHQPALLTTPDCSSVHSMLQKMVQAGDQACCMEVTSHALMQGRVAGIRFKTALFTNLSHEHLDYHATMHEYAAAKGRLFQALTPGARAVVNIDSPWGQEMVRGCSAEVSTYSRLKEADFQAVDIVHGAGTAFTLKAYGKEYRVTTPLIGNFNVENLLGALAVAYYEGIELSSIVQALASFQGPPGRLEKVDVDKDCRVYVDYAHKAEALEKVLESIRPNCKGRLILVFGCGGDRDREKRSKMGAIAERLADIVIVTSDNPRTEEPMAIIDQILAGCKNRPQLFVDREEAIFHACTIARAQDVVIIAGKGHEKRQFFKDKTVHFDDVEVAKRACK